MNRLSSSVATTNRAFSAQKSAYRLATSQLSTIKTTVTPPTDTNYTAAVKKYPKPLRSKLRGRDILADPLWNKMMAFDISERDRLGLRGLLPPAVRSLESQVERNLGHLRNLPDDVSKNLFLQEIHSRNETLYHRMLVDYIEEIAPLVYTPTVGVVCQQFGNRFTRSRGMYFSTNDRGKFSTMVHNWPQDDVHIIVVTDGSRILGLGDLGVHGMGIPIGKLALYCAAGGIAPHRVLPITLDVGTNNEELLNDSNYLGLRHKRLEGDEYYDFVEEFMQAVFGRWPNVVVQFEDFETSKAIPLLRKYRNRYRCFNDDIQGTGCVTLAGVMSAAKLAGKKISDLKFICAGAGSAGLGVCNQIVEGMMEEGMSRNEATERFVLFSSKGAIGAADGKYNNPNHTSGLHEDNGLHWINDQVSDGASMLEVAKSFGANVLLGLSAQPNIFTEEIVRAVAENADRPIIMPMSNPTSKSECSAEQAYQWTDGKAIVATGSPFKPVDYNGRSYVPSQCNNMYIFPGIGLAASVAGITTITDKMLYKAAVACSESMSVQEIEEGRTFPNIKRIRDVSHKVACAVIHEGLESGLATKITKKQLQMYGVENIVTRKMYRPVYVPIL